VVPQAWRVLGRLELLRIAAFWRRAVTDLVFDFAVVGGLVIGWFALRQVWRGSQHTAPATLAVQALAAGAVLAWQLHPKRGSKPREQLQLGPFHLLVAGPRQMDRWMLARTAALCLALLGLAALVFATLDPLFGLGFLVLSMLGVGAYGLVSPALVGREQAVRATPIVTAGSQRRWPAELFIGITTRRRSPFASVIGTALLVVVGGLLGGLAARNNSQPALGQTFAAICAGLAGVAWLPGGRLPGVLGREPLGLIGLYVWLYAVPLGAALVGGLAGGVAAGEGPAMALQTASMSFTGVFVLAWMNFLHRMIRSERNAPTATALEFLNSLMLSAVETSLAPFYLLVRGVILVRAAGHRRWLDR
jgi:hypothetical protein